MTFVTSINNERKKNAKSFLFYMILNPLQVFHLIWEHFLECFTKLPVHSKGTVNHISK